MFKQVHINIYYFFLFYFIYIYKNYHIGTKE